MSVVVALSLLHFIWEGTVIGVAAWASMKLVHSASARYYIGVTALALMAASPVATAMWIRDGVVQSPEFRLPSSSPGVPGSSGVPASVQFVQDPERTPDPRTGTRHPALGTLDTLRAFVRVSPSLAKWLLGSWLLGVGLLSVRLSLGLWTARRLTRLSVREPRAEILSSAARLMAALRISGAVKVLESALVQVPTAMGWLKPVVLLPAQAMTGLSMAQIDALVAHELAHIKRHDYLVNLFQSAIETLLFYHPAVWLISRRVRHERELCCDDMAIAACGDDRLTYASALADLEQMRQVPVPILAANGGSLLTRVKRILSPDDLQTVRGTGHWMAGVAILLTVLVGAAAQSVQGRQVVQGAQGVVGGIVSGVKGGVADGVTGGVVGGVKDATPGGVAGGVMRGVSGGVAEGVKGGIPGNVIDHKSVPETIALPEVQSVAPPLSATAPATEYKIQPLDVLKVTVTSGGMEQTAFGQDVGVQSDGSITLPLLGRVVVGGQTLDETSKQIRAALILHRLFTEATVDVTAKWFHRILTSADKAQVALAPDDATGRAVKSQALYDAAYADYASAKYDLAIEGFKTLLRVYPDEAAASKAQFYIAEGHFASRRYAEAEAAYTAYIDTYTGAWWLADAYYKRAKCFELMGATREARVDLELVIKIFPNSTLTPIARAALAGLPQPQTGKVKVQGAVNKPGNWALTSDHMNIADALTVAGGLSYSAGWQIRVRRTGSAEWETFKRSDFESGKLVDVKVADGDAIDVPVGPKFFVQGFVMTPGEFQWEENLTLERALLMAGGVTPDGAKNRLTIRRKDPKTNEYKSIKLDKDAMKTLIQPDDVISVPKRRL